MAALGTQLSEDTVADTGNFSGGLHPEGIFEFEMRESDVKATSNGNGLMAAFTAFGTGNNLAPSDNKDLRVWANFNIKNPSAQAQSIGQAQFKALFEACGGIEVVGVDFHNLEDTEKLHYLPFWAEVVHKPRMSKNPKTGKYDIPVLNDDGSPKISAEFKRFMFDGMDEVTKSSPPAGKPAAQSPAPDPKPAAAAAAGGRRPWSK